MSRKGACANESNGPLSGRFLIDVRQLERRWRPFQARREFDQVRGTGGMLQHGKQK